MGVLELRFVRDKPGLVKERLRNKGVEDGKGQVDTILRLDEQRRGILGQVEELKHRRNVVSREVGDRKGRGEESEALVVEMRQIRGRIDAMDKEVVSIRNELDMRLLELPNIHHESSPVGADESENVEMESWGEPREFHFEPKPHWEIAEDLGLANFEWGAKVSGARFYTLTGLGAKLERALVNFMLDLHTEKHGYTEIFAPFLVRPECMVGTGQLPKFGDDAFALERDNLWLVPTAEVSVTNVHREEVMEPGSLPLNYVSYSACFRREAGAAGRDTRGFTRVHQFNKVELVKLVEPEASYDELKRLLRDACNVLELLGIPYRVMEICTGDLGFTATKKFDPEAWMPGQNRFVEVSSCSNFEDFQARRARVRYRPKLGKSVRFVHTLNGSGLAVGRTSAAILENCQQEDGSVKVPELLRSYMGGIEKIESR